VLFIAFLTLLPGKYLSGIDWNFLSIDKSIHFTVFLILTFLGSFNFKKRTWTGGITTAVLVSLGIAIMYGSILEYAQTFIPERGFDYADLTANIVGALSGIALFLVVNNKIKE
jgi:VanZ family protein